MRRRALLTGSAALSAYAALSRAAKAFGIGKLGSGFGGMGRIGGGSSVPAWVLSGAAVDMDFANGRYFGGTLANLLSISRASNATDLIPSSASGYTYNTYGSNVLAISPTFGLLIFEARTNLLLNSAVPATQTTAALGTGTYTLWVNGSGSALASGGTATITGAAPATNGSPNVITVTVAGTVTVTVTGSLNFFQLELGAFGTSGIVTGGVTATRAADNITLGTVAKALLNGASGQVFMQFSGINSTLFPVMLSGNNSNNSILEQSNNTVGLTWNGSAGLNATLGTSTWSAGPVKSVDSWTPSGRTLVINNGTEASDAGLIVTSPPSTWWLGSLGGSSRFADTPISRLTFWNAPLGAAARKALTV